VPATPRDHVTTEELLAVTRSSRDTLYEWVVKRLLPRPSITTGPAGDQYAVWPAEALERVRFIVGKIREGIAIDEVVALVEARWPRR
jgi:predicted DNA-binding transcriptional regulator AlpA